jgi:hypothetical protein
MVNDKVGGTKLFHINQQRRDRAATGIRRRIESTEEQWKLGKARYSAHIMADCLDFKIVKEDIHWSDGWPVPSRYRAVCARTGCWVIGRTSRV